MSAASSASGPMPLRGALLVEQAERRLAHDGDVVGRRHEVGPGAVGGAARWPARTGASAASAATVASRRRRHAPSSAGRSPSPAQRHADSWTYGGRVSAASGRRCGPSARRRARGPPPRVRAVSARIGSAIGAPRRGAPCEPVVDDRRRDLGVELQPDAAARRRTPAGPSAAARQLRGARREVEDVLVPGEPAPADSRRRPRRRSSRSRSRGARLHRRRRGRRRAPGRRSRCPAPARRRRAPRAGTPPARAIHGSFEACTERSEPERDDGAVRARVGPRGDRRARAARRPARPARAAHSPTSPAGASGCCWTTSRRSRLPLHAERAAHERVDAAEVRVGAGRQGRRRLPRPCGWRPA